MSNVLAMMAGLPGIRRSILGVMNVIDAKERVKGLDPEWLALILEAKELGISKDAIQCFFSQSGTIERVCEQDVHKQ